MIRDFSTRVTGKNTAGQAITATAVSTDAIDLLAAGANLGPGEPVRFSFAVGPLAAFNNLTSLTVDVITSAAVGLGTPTVVATSGAVPLANLTAGRVIFEGILPNASLLQFLGARFTVAGSNPSTGAVVGDIGFFDIQTSFTGGPA